MNNAVVTQNLDALKQLPHRLLGQHLKAEPHARSP